MGLKGRDSRLYARYTDLVKKILRFYRNVNLSNLDSYLVLGSVEGKLSSEETSHQISFKELSIGF